MVNVSDYTVIINILQFSGTSCGLETCLIWVERFQTKQNKQNKNLSFTFVFNNIYLNPEGTSV